MKKYIWIFIFVLNLVFAQDNRDRDVQRLLKDLSSQKWYVRYNAARTLGHLKVTRKDVITSLTKMLKDKDQYIRYAAVVALGQMEASSAIDEVMRLIQPDEHDYIQETALECLAKIGKEEPRIIPLLEERILFSLKPYGSEKIAIRALYNICLQAKYSPLDFIRELKAYFMRKQKKQVMPQNMIAGLFVLLDKSEIHPDYRIVQGEEESIGQTTGHLLDKIAEKVVSSVIASLEEFEEKTIVFFTLKILTNLKLWVTNPDRERIRKILYTLSKNSDYEMRMEAIYVMAKFDMVSAQIKHFLFEEMKKEKKCRYLVRNALYNVNPDVSDMDYLMDLLKNKKTEYLAMHLLSKLGPKAKAAVPHLMSIALHGNYDQQESAIETLSKINEQITKNILIYLVSKSDSPNAEMAQKIARTRSKVGLRSLIDKGNAEMIRYALESIEPVDLSIISIVCESLRVDYGLEVSRMIASPLVKLREKAIHAIPPLVELLNSENRIERNNAVDVLADLRSSRYSPAYEQWDYNLRKAVEKTLQVVVHSEQKYAKFYAAYALAKMDKQRYLNSILSDALTHQNQDIAKDATRLLGLTNSNYISKAIMRKVVKMFGRVNKQSQYDIVRFLFRRDDLSHIDLTDFIPSLIQTLNKERHPIFIAKSLELLHKIGAPASSAIPVLLKIIEKNPGSEIQQKAVQALTYMNHNLSSIGTLHKMLRKQATAFRPTILSEIAEVLEQADTKNLVVSLADMIEETTEINNLLLDIGKRHPWITLNQLEQHKHNKQVVYIIEQIKPYLQYSPLCVNANINKFKYIQHDLEELFNKRHFYLGSSLKTLQEVYTNKVVLEGIISLPNKEAKKRAFSASIAKRNHELFPIFLTEAETSRRKCYALKVLAKLKLQPFIMLPTMQKIIEKRYLYLADGDEYDRLCAIKILSQFPAQVRNMIPKLKKIAANCYPHKAEIINHECGLSGISDNTNKYWYQKTRKEAILVLNKIDHENTQTILKKLLKDPHLEMQKFAKKMLQKKR